MSSLKKEKTHIITVDGRPHGTLAHKDQLNRVNDNREESQVKNNEHQSTNELVTTENDSVAKSSTIQSGQEHKGL